MMVLQGRLVTGTVTVRKGLVVVTDVSPVLPPRILLMLFTNVVVIDVPITYPTVVATVSAIREPLILEASAFVEHVCFCGYSDQCSDCIQIKST